MSPSRTRKPVTRTRPRHELIIAIAGGAAIAIGTVLLIWLLRPGPPGTEGTGGLFSRQQRSTLLFFITAAALVGVVWWFLRRHKAKRVSTPVAIGISAAVVVVLAVVAGIFWPGGLVKHYQSLVEVPDTPITTPESTPTPPSSTPKSTPKTSTPGTTAAPAPTSTPTTGG